MIDREDIHNSLTGAWKIFVGQPDAMRHFDTSYAGFWRSFQAIFLIAPLYAVTMVASWRTTVATTPPDVELIETSAFFWSRGLTLAVDWITLPILLALLSTTLGISRTYAPYIVARNWSNVLIAVPYSLIGFLEIVLGGGLALILPLSLLVLAVMLRYAYMVVRTALQVPQVMAISIVVLDFFLSIFIAITISSLMGLPTL